MHNVNAYSRPAQSAGPPSLKVAATAGDLSRLRAPQRSWAARFFGLFTRRPSTPPDVRRLGQSDLVTGPRVGAGAAPAKFAWVASVARGLSTQLLARKVEELSEGKADELQPYLQQQGAEQIKLQLARELKPTCGWFRKSTKAREKAEVVFTAMTKGLATAQQRPEVQAALVRQQRARTVAEQVATLEGHLGALEQSRSPLVERARELNRISQELAQLAGGGDRPLLASLQGRIELQRGVQQRELIEGMGAQVKELAGKPVGEALADAPALQAQLVQSREAAAVMGALPEGQQVQVDKLLERMQGLVDTVEDAGPLLDRYDAIRGIDARNEETQPCKPLADHLRAGSVETYRTTQGKVDQICARAHPEDHEAVLAKLGDGIQDGRGGVAFGLIDDVVQGKPEAVDKIFGFEQWDELVLSLKLGGLDQQQEKELQKAGVDPARQQDIGDAFAARRFSMETTHSREVVNTEINRLLRAHDPARQGDLVGDKGQAPGASTWSIDQLKKLGGGLDKEVDLLLTHWIYLSALDPASQAINDKKVDELLRHFNKGRSTPVDLSAAKEQYRQGHVSSASVKQSKQLICDVADRLAKASALAQASQLHDPSVQARGLVERLKTQLTDGAQAQGKSDQELLAEKVEQCKDEWRAAGGPGYLKLATLTMTRDALFAHLASTGWKLQRDKSGNLPNLASAPDQAPMVDRLVEYGKTTRALQAALVDSSVSAKAKKQIVAKYTGELADLRAQLKGFDVTSRTMGAVDEEPSHSQLTSAGMLGQLEELATLQNVCVNVQGTRQLVDKTPNPRAAELQDMVEGASRVAILEEALDAHARGEPATRAGVMKRLKEFGLTLHDPHPHIRDLVRDVWRKVNAQDFDLAKLTQRFDPLRSGSKGLLRPSLPGAPVTSQTTPKVPAQPDALTGAQKRRLRNMEAVEQRFKSLEPGQSFEVRFGHEGELSVSNPLVIGVSQETQLSARTADAVRVVRTAQGYEVQVTQERSGSLAASVSFLGILTLGGKRSEGTASGFRATCEDPEAAQRLVKALVGQEPMDAATGDKLKFHTLDSRSSDTQATVRARLSIDVTDDLSLASVEGELLKARGEVRTSSRSGLTEVERWNRQHRRIASGSASALGGKFSKEAEMGQDLSVTRSFVRRAGLLREGSGFEVQARVVGGDVRTSLCAVMPHLLKPEASSELAQYVESVESALGAMGSRDSGLQVRLECAMTRRAMNKANDWYRNAQEHLKVAGHRSGIERAAALRSAREALAQADQIARDPASYVFKAFDVVVDSTAKAAKGAGRKSFAEVAGSQATGVAVPGAGEGQGTLDPAYARLLGSGSMA
ncbi:hypothetical protein JI739_07195 [Ramlibacter sp. AW1]|uniref:Uncharacterized protein n=1 Tax=Ramlibacter aurantiacus TaxID=2801330 RepID=A0A936ZPL7_9BURK|nr:hypothetical protein [Ramlibacter aurantiacus]MBL0420131.1 hypothetical protein [Ramlibacter aurantiacus]